MGSNSSRDPGPGSDSDSDPDAGEDPRRLIEQLIDTGVLQVTGDASGEREEGLRLSGAFADRIEACRETVTDLAEPALRDEVADLVADDDEVDALLDSVELDPDFLAEYLALARTDADALAHGDRLRALTLFDALRDAVPDAGSPGPFVPVRGDRLPLLLRLHQRAVVYVWRDDCPPCDLMRESFETVVDEPPEDVALLSVYGPDCAALLQERYDVVGGPTTLFVYGGDVDARLHGAHADGVVENELRKLREL